MSDPKESGQLMRHLTSALALMGAVFAGATAVAETHPVVVELYTSQGCSSCPPADAMLAELAQRDDVIALALHVDYWDYIGWADDFADPSYTQRQQDYAHAAGSATIYTPQMVIGGVDHVIGSRPMEVADLLLKHSALTSDVALDISRTADAVTISATAGDDPQPMVVQLVQFTPEATRQITRGENAGQEITYVNIVHTWRNLALWDGRAPLTLQSTVTGDDPVAVLIQQGSDGPVVAAAQLR